MPNSSDQHGDRIQPRTLKGFRDYLPEVMILRERLIETAQKIYRSYGFAPIDTPALEYLDILLGKGSEETDKQLYQFEDHGGRSVGLRFDLTVPLARFVAQHAATLGMPFKRYHIGTVWRGENTQRGRYREFLQCDFDTIGTESIVADIETVLVIHDLFRAIGFSRFTILVNDRRVLSGLLQNLALGRQEPAILRALDKLPKIGLDHVADEIISCSGASMKQVDRILAFAGLEGSNRNILEKIHSMIAGSAIGESGARSLDQFLAGVIAAGVPTERVQLDPAIARGLDYYTGTVLETRLDDLPEIGSVASGGRYDSLVDLFAKQKLPGIGASLGLDRLLAAMDALGMTQPVRTPADVLIPYFERDHLGDYLQLAARLRESGLAVEVFPDAKKLGKQLQYANRRGHRVAIILGANEFAGGICQVKNLASGETSAVPLTETLSEIVLEISRVLEINRNQ
ncbi:MAG: histidine--tRNA ligase [Pirellulales bacterium]|nr:histidine--tRNA ligase [Pirellulales bacterium]